MRAFAFAIALIHVNLHEVSSFAFAWCCPLLITPSIHFSFSLLLPSQCASPVLKSKDDFAYNVDNLLMILHVHSASSLAFGTVTSQTWNRNLGYAPMQPLRVRRRDFARFNTLSRMTRDEFDELGQNMQPLQPPQVMQFSETMMPSRKQREGQYVGVAPEQQTQDFVAPQPPSRISKRGQMIGLAKRGWWLSALTVALDGIAAVVAVVSGAMALLSVIFMDFALPSATSVGLFFVSMVWLPSLTFCCLQMSLHISTHSLCGCSFQPSPPASSLPLGQPPRWWGCWRCQTRSKLTFKCTNGSTSRKMEGMMTMCEKCLSLSLAWKWRWRETGKSERARARNVWPQTAHVN